MKCSDCSHDLDGKLDSCPNCHQKVVTVQCPECFQINSIHYSTCSKCSFNLKEKYQQFRIECLRELEDKNNLLQKEVDFMKNNTGTDISSELGKKLENIDKNNRIINDIVADKASLYIAFKWTRLVTETLPDEQGNLAAAVYWMIGLCLLLAWIPIIGPFVAGFVGGRKAGTVVNALMAAIVPCIVYGLFAAIVVFVFSTAILGSFWSGILLGGTFFSKCFSGIAPLVTGAAIGGATVSKQLRKLSSI